ncbi:MAG TPA: hypothetical protein VFT82_01145 [Candidatus Paceibacterota bacterium]|nr:hypothetical protein [Candidatus Paceibacterota bacterium]
MKTVSTRELRFRKLFILLAFCFLVLFGASKIFGLMRNALCYPYLGCNIGFFGYDALLHFVSGMMEVAGLVWLGLRYRLYSFQDRFWKNAVFLIALIALIAVSWEFVEFAYDHFRMDILHTNLTNPNQMAQASNSDTMGDIFFSMLGSAITIFGTRLFKKGK